MGLFTKQEKTINKVISVPIHNIKPNPAQPRQMFEIGELQSLAESICENGILQPLTVRKDNQGEYELISGERRLKAAKLAKLPEVPCIMMQTDPKQSAIFALIENIQRKDLNYFEEAVAIEKLIKKWDVTQEEASKRLGKAQSTIANKLRLLKLNEKQQQLLIENCLTERHARALLKLPDSQAVDKAVHYIVSKKLNVRQTESYIEAFLKEEVKPVRRIIPVIKDVRVFLNTINHAVEVMQKAGIPAKTKRVDEDNCIQYIIKIPSEVANKS